MAFGLSVGSGSGADFLPVVKYDARAGRVFRVDRDNGGSTQHDITRSFKAVVDMENVEVGYIRFAAGVAPDFQMVPLGSALPAKPTDDHRQGVRLVLKLHKDCGGDVRELAGTSAAMIGGLEDAHNAYLAGVKTNAGKLPVIVLRDTVPVESGKGQNKSTNYRPHFEIIGWVDRPADLKPQPRGQVASAPPAANDAARAAPPSTGSTRVSAPAPAPVGDDDFG
jgi:hypothetical protein